MQKIFQTRINNSDLMVHRKKYLLSNELENWNRNSSKTFMGILKTIFHNDNVKVSFSSNTSFKIKNGKKEYQGVLEYGDMDEMPKIRIINGDVTSIYEVLNLDSENKTLINLDSEIIKRNDTKVTQMFANGISYFTVRIDDVVYRICIYAPDSEKDKVSELPHEDELKETLFSFHKNTSLKEIIQILEYYLGKLDTYPKVEISRRIEEKRKFPKTTDEFIIKDGSLNKYMQTKQVGTKNYVVTIENDKISYNIENLDFNDIAKPDSELVNQGMQYVKRYPKK